MCSLRENDLLEYKNFKEIPRLGIRCTKVECKIRKYNIKFLFGLVTSRSHETSIIVCCKDLLLHDDIKVCVFECKKSWYYILLPYIMILSHVEMKFDVI